MNPESRVFIASADDAGLRADQFLAARAELTRNAAQRLIAEGAFTLSGRPVGKSERIEEGLSYHFTEPPAKPSALLPLDLPLDIVYEDGDLIVLNKPRGLVVHPAAGHENDTLVNALLMHAGESLSGIGGEIRPGIVHRLDKDTSGLLVVAKNDRAHASLAEQLKERTFSRVYEAVVRGRLPEHSGRIDAPVARHPSHRKKMAVNRIAGKPAATRYEVIAEYAGYSYIRCILETGRTHQIRVHMAHVGHPVTGDTVYGGGDEFHIGGQCLHAKSAAFTHPSTGERLTFAANLPDYFEKVLTILRNRS